MKISELNPLANLQAAAQIPVAVAGENRSITLGQIIKALQNSIVPFGYVFDKMARYAIGSTDVMGSIVFDVFSRKFHNCISVFDKVSGVTSYTLYSEWPGKDSYYADADVVRTDCLFITAEGRLYRFNGDNLISAGLTDEQTTLLKKLTPQAVASESALEAMEAAGEIVPGQIYYIAETE